MTDTQALRGLGPCLPAEVSPQFFFWPVTAQRPITLVNEDDEAVEASWVLYRRGRSAVAVVWLHSDLVSVDPSPETETPTPSAAATARSTTAVAIHIRVFVIMCPAALGTRACSPRST